MSTLNKVMLIGNLTRDPSVRHTAKGTAVAELGLALNRSYTIPDTGERKEEVTFLDVVLWDRQAETAAQYLEKGRSVFVEGRLQLDTWQDKETGKNRQKIVVIGERVQFLEKGRNSGDQANGGPAERDGERGGYQNRGSHQETRAREARPGSNGSGGSYGTRGRS